MYPTVRDVSPESPLNTDTWIKNTDTLGCPLGLGNRFSLHFVLARCSKNNKINPTGLGCWRVYGILLLSLKLHFCLKPPLLCRPLKYCLGKLEIGAVTRGFKIEGRLKHVYSNLKQSNITRNCCSANEYIKSLIS